MRKLILVDKRQRVYFTKEIDVNHVLVEKVIE